MCIYHCVGAIIEGQFLHPHIRMPVRWTHGRKFILKPSYWQWGTSKLISIPSTTILPSSKIWSCANSQSRIFMVCLEKYSVFPCSHSGSLSLHFLVTINRFCLWYLK
jgi:hypothetical protein